jgi:menaquinone-dependent protoporphyrinogen oxidase
MKEITDLTPYRAVVAGSPIHKKMWLPEAMQFVQTHREQLSQKPFAAFLSCLTLAMKNQKWVAQAGVENWLAPVRAQVTPVSEGRFAGTLELKKIPSFAARLGFRISVWTGVWKEGDHRDWQAIRVWAEEVAVKLRG